MLQNLTQTVLANTLSVGLLNLTGVPDKLNLGSGRAMFYLKNGIVLAGSEDAVDWWMSNSSLLQQMRWQDFIDKSISNTALFAGVDYFSLDDKLYEFVQGISPLPEFVNQSVSMGVLLTLFISLRDFWEQSGNYSMVMLNHPTRLFFP